MLGDTNLPPRVAREVLVRGAKFSIERVSVPGDPTFPPREVVRHPGAVIVLPLVEGSAGLEVVLIRNWRISVEASLWELPAGTMEPPEPPLECARRELQEETGFRAATVEPMFRFHTSPGLSDEVMHAFVARGLVGGESELQADERVTAHPTPAYECLRMIEDGVMTDAKSMLVLLRAKAMGLLG
ncbi:MAG: NUDIX hydrolase [Leptolyngbya sp. PLA1]|nr:NUDIX hydrolase [Leptolyngbya sp. PLA1]